ncbi:TPA: hypothetical protein VDW08_003766 [Pseudomonas aeruginosa]|nr:hypothetical protein [Pseudomonas aeruginosa]
MSQEFFTAGFQVKDSEQFKELAKQITASLAEEKELSGSIVTAAGWGDEMTAADNMRAWLDNRGEDTESIERGEA